MKSELLRTIMYLSKSMFYLFLIQTVSLQLLFAGNTTGQTLKEVEVDIYLQNATLVEVFSEIEEKTKFSFVYDRSISSAKKKFSINGKSKSLEDVLLELAKNYDLRFQRINSSIYVKKTSKKTDLEDRILEIDKNLSGKVTDDSGQPLIGATVLLKGTTIGTVTDIDGSFDLSVPENAETLIVSYIGYISQEIPIGSQTNFSIELGEDVSGLNEVIVVGYGVQKKSDVTGSISSVKSEDFNNGVVTNPGQLLQGKIAGVNITNASGEPGASQNIIIRGIGSLRSGTTPLFVVDGFLLDNSSNGVANNPLNFLNPNDIASIEVLKDASAAALYGTRASNGVVVITTKKGSTGKTKFELSASTAWSTIANKMDVFSADEFRTQVNAIQGVLTDGGGSTDWQDELTQTARSQDYNLSMSGGSENASFYASVGVQQQEGILKKSQLDRYSGKLKMSQKGWNGRINVNYNLTAARTENLRPDISGTISDMLDLNPTFNAVADNGEFSFLPEGRINPLLRNELYSDEAINNRILANVAPSVEIVQGLTYKINLGVDYSQTNRYIQNRAISLSQFQQFGSLATINTENTNTLIENTLRYAFDLEKHSISFLAGHGYQEFSTFRRRVDQAGFETSSIDPINQDYISSDINMVEVDVVAVKDELQSFFGRLDYGYESKYLLTATLRADGTSRFGGNNKYAYLPSVGLGWNITNETFFQSSLFDNLKLRASWGVTGNQELASKSTLVEFEESRGSQTTYPLEDDQLTIDDYPVGITFVRLANPDLQWEESRQTDVGLDFTLLNFRLTGTIDYFNKVSDNILLFAAVADPIAPTSSQWQNIPNMEIHNSGVELSLAYSSDPSSDFQWTVGGNVSKINNEIVNSPFLVLTTGAAIGAGQTGATINGYINGEPVGSFYTLTFDGIGDDGLNQFVDLDTDNEQTDLDRSVVGSALPDVVYGFYTNMSYKGFDLSLNFNGVSGNDIYNHNRMEIFSRGLLATSNNTTAFATEFPNESNTNSNTVSTRYLEDGSFLRLNNVTLGYSLTPEKVGLVDNTFSNIRLYVTGQNLFVISDYSGFDPEVNTGSNRGDVQNFGIDRLTYPTSRTFLIGIRATF